jgi:uncharacterized RDD family membrane protein YckC
MSYQNYSSSNEPTTDLFAPEPIIYAGFWERFGASFIDGIILLIPNLFFSFILGSGPGDVLSILSGWLYFALQESGSAQATIGKKAVGLKVVNAEAQKISFGQASGRHFGKIISTLILFIGYLMMTWDEKKQTLHDKMADTYVVKS